MLLAAMVVPHPAMGHPQGNADLVPTMTLVGDAKRSAAELWLTTDTPGQRGGAWSPDELDVANGFIAQFTMRISGGWGGDGFAFVIQASAGDALGGGGGAIGYGVNGGLIKAIPNSVAVEFDTFANWEEGDPPGLDISVHTRGTLPNDQAERYSIGSTTHVPPFSNGSVHHFVVGYEPGTLTILAEGRELLAVPVDLATLLALDDGRAWLGFTAATGGVSESHEILAFTVSSGS
jgi:hypothetical protein